MNKDRNSQLGREKNQESIGQCCQSFPELRNFSVWNFRPWQIFKNELAYY